MHQNEKSKWNHLKLQQKFSIFEFNFLDSKLKTKYAKNSILSPKIPYFPNEEINLQVNSASSYAEELFSSFVPSPFVYNKFEIYWFTNFTVTSICHEVLMVINLWYIKALKLLTTMVNNISCFVKESHKKLRPLTPSVLSLSHKKFPL